MNNWNYFQEKYGDPIGVGAQCQVYRRDHMVYKVLSEGHVMHVVMREGYALSLAEQAGIPVSNIHGVYQEAGHIVMEMDYVAGKSLKDLLLSATEKGDAAAIDAYLDDFVSLQMQLHSKPIVGLSTSKQNCSGAISLIPFPSTSQKDKLLDYIAGLEDGTALCHNDFHPLNIISDNGHYVIIDWDSATIGDSAGDVAHSYLICLMYNKILGTIYPDFAEKYLQKYLDKTQINRKRIEEWLPVHATILYAVLVAGDPENAEMLLPFINV